MSAVDLMGGCRSARGFFRVSIFTLVLALPVVFFAQGYFGTVSGQITDPSQAVVPGAQVTLIDQQKGYQFNTTSDKGGRYLFGSIPPGKYSVSAEMAGFEKSVFTNITVNVSENATANLHLKVATARQAI